jgi:MoaA/NifB/PqqE/SkfB family radical SAM enzyme
MRNWNINKKYYFKKIQTIKRLRSEGVNVAVQSVIHKKNVSSIINMPAMLRHFSIKQWYIQRFIPSYRTKDRKNLELTSSELDKAIAELMKRSRQENIECIAKKDRRHNCVFLLVGNGHLYTQGGKPGQKIPIGTIYSDIRYFSYVSSSDHAERYYGY